jgi:FtsZ-interacting cell division protein YlmF
MYIDLTSFSSIKIIIIRRREYKETQKIIEYL